MASLQLKVPPLLLTVTAAALMAVAAWGVPAADVGIPVRVPLALGIAGAGLFVTGAGVAAFRRHRTTMNPLDPGKSSSLVSTGIYRFTRNPMYLGFLLVLAGWAVYLSSAMAALFLPLFVLYMDRYQIEPEEQALRNRFGRAFDDYCADVRRWL